MVVQTSKQGRQAGDGKQAGRHRTYAEMIQPTDRTIFSFSAGPRGLFMISITFFPLLGVFYSTGMWFCSLVLLLFGFMGCKFTYFLFRLVDSKLYFPLSLSFLLLILF